MLCSQHISIGNHLSFAKGIRKVLEEELGQINAFARFTSSHSQTSLNSELDIEYIRLRGGLASGSSGI